jgi:site-specific recombinase XerD
MKALSEENARALDRFADGLWLNDGLARNTLESYRRDMKLFAAWLDEARGVPLIAASPADLQRHLAWQVEVKHAKPRTTGRLVSSLKRFYLFAVREGLRRDDPAVDLDSPKLPRSLPKSLSEEEVEALLEAPDDATPQGLRDRAMLETLYASGLRVSELVGLKSVQVSLDMNVVRVLGKGSKERLTPLGAEAAAWIARYQREARPEILRRAQVRRALRHRAWPPDDAPVVLVDRQAPRRACRDSPPDLAAHAAPRLRHPPHQPRRRPAGGAAAARPRRHLHHADLHARCARAPEGAAPQAPPARMIDYASLSPWLLVVAPIVIIIAYTVFGLTGFGSTIISVPILAHYLPISYLVPLMALLDCASAAFVGTSGRKHLSKAELKRLMPFMFVGFVAGVTLLVGLPDDYLRMALGLFAMVIGIYSIFNPSLVRTISTW